MVPFQRLIGIVEKHNLLLSEDITRLTTRKPENLNPPTDSGEPELSTEPARSGVDTLRYGDRYLHSSVDPQREAERIARDLNDDPHPDIVLCFGLGLGYQFKAIRDILPGVPIVGIIAHPDELTLLASEWEPDRLMQLGPDRILCSDDLPEIRQLIEEYHAMRPRLIGLTGFRSVFPDQWRAIDEAIRAWQQREQVNRNTLRRFGKRWVRNTIHNLARYGIQPGIDDIAETATGLPAVVFGAGPTLDELAPLLAPCAKALIVIAVDTALPALERYGIRADLAVIADPQYWNSRHIDRIVPGSTVLIAEPATYPRILRLWNGPRLVSASLFPLGQYIDQRTGRRKRLGAGGSVATSAWDLARVLGVRDIGLAGVDLGFPRLRTHCEDSYFEHRLIHTADRLHPAEHGMARYLHDGVPSRVDRAGGGTVLSDQRMAVYRSWFGEQAQHYPEIETVLLSAEGSAIPGLSYEPVRDFLARTLPGSSNEAQDRKRNVLDAIRRSGSDPPQAPVTAATILVELHASFIRIEELARAGREYCDRFRAKANPSPAVLRELDRIDAELMRASDGEMAGFIAAERVMAAAEQTAHTVTDSIDQARDIYSAISEACAFHQNIIARYAVLPR